MAFIKPFDKMNAAEKKATIWERDNLIEDYGYFIKKPAKLKSVRDNVLQRGYEAVRISPRTTTKNGKLYRQVYGATVDYGGKVTFHSQGYIREGRAKGGTTPAYSLKDMAKNYGTTEARLKSQLMVK